MIGTDDGRNPFKGTLKIAVIGSMLIASIWVVPCLAALALYLIAC